VKRLYEYQLVDEIVRTLSPYHIEPWTNQEEIEYYQRAIETLEKRLEELDSEWKTEEEKEAERDTILIDISDSKYMINFFREAEVFAEEQEIQEQNEKILSPFRETIESWVDFLAVSKPKPMKPITDEEKQALSKQELYKRRNLGIAIWKQNNAHHREVSAYTNFIEEYILKQKKLPTGSRYITGLYDKRITVNFDECPKSTINRRKV
jgi:hypothetical protein